MSAQAERVFKNGQRWGCWSPDYRNVTWFRFKVDADYFKRTGIARNAEPKAVAA